MEATARVPGTTATPTGTGNAGGHIHQLIRLATALTTAATGTAAASSSAAAGPAAGGGAGGLADPVVPAPLGVSLDSLGDAEVIAWGRSIEQLGRWVQALQVHAAGTIATRAAEGRYLREGHKSAADVLTGALLLSRAEAGRRLNLARHFLPDTDPLTTVTTPCDQPILATAFFTGTTTAEQALTASHYAADANHLAQAGRTTKEKARELEATMSAHAQTQNPDFLRRIGTHAITVIDPDGDKPTEGELIARQGIRFHRACRGLVKISGHATIAQYESIMAYIGHSTNPRPHKDVSTINPGTGAEIGGETSCDTGLGSGGEGPGTAGVAMLPGQLDLMDFLHAATGGTDAGETSSTGEGSAGDARRIFPESPPPAGIGWQPRPDGTPANRASTPTPTNNSTDGSNHGNGTNGSSVDLGGSGRSGAAFWATPGVNPPDVDGSGAAKDPPWPHLVEGIQVPEPGSDTGLPGLDPIDPNSTDFAVKDKRTHSQGLLDGLIDCLRLAARTGLLPLNGGLKPQLLISTTEADLQASRTKGKGGGIAFLPYTGPCSLSLLDTELCDADVTTVILGDGKNILNVGRAQRFFTDAHRKILIARDIGRTFPHCTRPAAWCDAHHIIPWQDGGETNISNGALLCEVHHTLIHQGHWTVRLFNGTPLYTPAHGTDPGRRDLSNPYHRGLVLPG